MPLPGKQRIEKSLGSLFDPLYFAYLLVVDLRSFRYFPEWFSSFRLGRAFLEEAKPWIPFAAAHWLRHYLQPSMKVFEYGSGGSTIFFAERVAEVTSVEHDKQWHKQVSQALAQRDVTNCSYRLHEPTPLADAFSAADQSEVRQFIIDDYYRATLHEYVQAIDVQPDGSLDLVFIDGRVRTQCIEHAIPKIRRGGYLMLDNSNNPDVAEIVRRLHPYSHRTFRSIAPGWPPARWTNTIWQIT
jgi:predicted O-methyltransferase YrrM